MKTVIKAGIGAALAIGIWTVGVPNLGRLIPDRWWYDLRDARVDSNTTFVTLDRTVGALWGDGVEIDGTLVPGWDGEMQVTIRQVGYDPATGEMLDDGRLRTSCPGLGRQIPFRAGSAYPKVSPTTGAPLDLARFMGAPPNSGCTLVPGAYVADFTISRDWFGIRLETHGSSNIFTMNQRLDMSEGAGD